MKTKKIIKASFFHSPTYGEIEFMEHAVLLVSDNGIISEIIRKEDENYQQILNQYSHESNFIDFKDKVLLPGFIDLHIHAPQWPQAGLALDDELSHWLNNFTFPLESKYKDINYAREVYTDLVKTLLANGTTSAMYFGTIHNEATLELAKICANLGQRSFVGKVVMDDETMNPGFYRDNSTKEAIENTERFINDIQKLSKKCTSRCISSYYSSFCSKLYGQCTLRVRKISKEI